MSIHFRGTTIARVIHHACMQKVFDALSIATFRTDENSTFGPMRGATFRHTHQATFQALWMAPEGALESVQQAVENTLTGGIPRE